MVFDLPIQCLKNLLHSDVAYHENTQTGAGRNLIGCGLLLPRKNTGTINYLVPAILPAAAAADRAGVVAAGRGCNLY